MRHQKIKGKLSRPTDRRKALLRSLLRGLIISGKIEVTLSQAKQTKRIMDRLLSLAKKDSLAAQRSAFRILGDRKLVYNLFRQIAPKFPKGGATRLIHLSWRRGDGAKMAVLEL
ncbi:MAG: 50S ribosomal protein L17 [Candidatus Omnitrophica bacterium 4484_213]|nr:MAG: 50S ribosomal protein L17 [Candidatus Omnitrophica bacterium 4484_213]